jgi:hypothetical protein
MRPVAGLRSAGVRLIFVALPLAVLCASAAGCGQEDAERDTRAVAERFHAAIERGDGMAACDELSEDAAGKLETQEKKPCEQAILTLEVGGGEPTGAKVFLTSASVTLAEGGTDFLDRTADGWKLTAVACTPVPGLPYECELEV